ncbi:MAG TPA: pantoate--beta-alanine ligase [Sphingobacterium sp.]|nr:pantoate--beta-alanine ligase [Sphingobacterium sp.]
MEIFKTRTGIKSYLDERKTSLKVGFVPTMGALHEGHISLIEAAKKNADITVCSIFVNPTQFNDPKDLAKYPRPIEQDIAMLESAGCDVLFLPSVEEIYPNTHEEWHIDLGQLDQIWEGKHRPGHFQGVTQVVNKLFQIVQPDTAYFGQKDFQQIMVIQKMVDVKNLPVQIIICPIIRDKDGLALSSRNVRLSPEGKKKALVISKTLRAVEADFTTKKLPELNKSGKHLIQGEPDVLLEYFAICETRTLAEATTIENNKQYVALAAAWVEGVRLIDNMLMNV